MYGATAAVITAFIALVGWVAWLVLRPGGSPSGEGGVPPVPDYPTPVLYEDGEDVVREPRMRPRA